MAYSAGTAYLEVVPSFLNVESLLAKGARDIAKSLDKTLGGQVGKAFQNASRSAERDTERAGNALGKTFADGAMKRVNAAIASISETDRVLRPLRKELIAISEIDITKGFDEKDFIARVEKAYDALRKAQQDAQGPRGVGRFSEAGNAARELGAVKDIVEAARKRGFAAGDAYSDAYLGRLKAMDRALPDLLTRKGSSPEQREIAAIKQRIQDAMKLAVGQIVTADDNPLNLPIGSKVDHAALKHNLEFIEGQLDQFVERAGSVELVVAADKARQQVGGFLKDIQTQQERANEEVTRQYLKDWDAALAENTRRREQQIRDYERLFDQAEQRNRQIDEQNSQLRLRQIRREFEERARLLKQQREQEYRAQQQAARDAQRLQEQEVRDAKRLADQLERERLRAFSQTTIGDAQRRARSAADRIVDLPVRLQANDIDRQMAGIRARVKALGDVHIGVDADVEEFADDVEREFRRLKAIARNNRIDIEVRADAAKAATELGGILVLLHRIDGSKAEVKIDSDSSLAGLQNIAKQLSLNLGRLGALIAVGSSLGTAIVPAAAAAAASIGFIGTAALSAGSGIGVLALAFSGIGDAVQALSKYADDQAKSNVALARSSSQVAAANDQIKSAEMALANTRRNNAEAAIRAQRAIRDAIEDQQDAIQDVARANQDAAQRVADAQRDLTEANREDISARERLNDAYVEARRALADLNSQIRGNSLDQRQATLDIKKAKQELDKLLANPRATLEEREQADITYQQRLLQMEDLKRRGAELADDQAKQNKKGIEGSDQVTRARQDIARADQARLAAQRALTRAQQDLVRTQLDGSRKLRDAERKVADARAAAADQQKDAAYAEYQAMQSLVAAHRALENATNRDSIAGGAALENLNTAMAKLSPTAQAFARYLFGLRDVFYKLRAAADPVLAGLQRAMESLLGKTGKDAERNLAPLFDFVHRVAQALGDIFVQFAELLKGPTFTRFFDYISKTAVPTLDLLWQMFSNLLTGVINLFLAFTPLTDEVGGSLLDLTERFRKWSEGLDKNKGFQRLIQYIRDAWPQVGHFLGEFLKFIGKIVSAAAPIGSVVVDLFSKLFKIINKIPEKTLTALVGGIAAAAGAIAIFAGATAVASLEIPGLIAGGIALLVAAFAALAGTTTNVGDILKKVWSGIKVAAQATFGFVKKAIVVLQPVFADMVEAAKAFWYDGLLPVFDLLKGFFSSIYEGIKPALGQVGGILEKLGYFFWQLYDGAILPVYKLILDAWHTVLNVLKPVFEVIGLLLGRLGAIFLWLLNNVVLPVVNGITWLAIHILIPAIQVIWKIVKPILQGIGILFQILAALVKVQIGIITAALKFLGEYFSGLYHKIIKPIWDLLVKYVFKPLGKAWDTYLKPYWDAFVGWLKDRMTKLGRSLGAVVKVFIHYVLNEGILKAYNWLADKFNITPRNVKITEPTGDWYTKSDVGAAFSRGGAVEGPGTKTSDSIRARLSRGEHVLTADEVEAAGGHAAVYRWRRQLMQGRTTEDAGPSGDGFGDWLKKTAKSLGKKATDVFDGVTDFLRDPAKSLSDLAKGLYSKVPGKDSWFVSRMLTIPNRILDGLKNKVKDFFGFGEDGVFSGALGNKQGGVGYQWQLAVLRAIFPHLGVYSTFRRNAHTLSGNLSWHARGRAVDVEPKRVIAQWIAANYGKNTLELITPWRDLMLWHGKPHKYSRAIEAQHGVFGQNAHIHWAYDNGGLLPDTRNMPGGVMQIFHGKRLPDKVLTDSQWRSMATLAAVAKDSLASGNSYNFQFRDTTLDPGKLRALQDREAVLARQGRAR